MRMSQSFIPTLREDPAEAELISHKLLLRAGYIRKLTAGVYTYLPLMQRVIHKVEGIVREEMDAAGAIEITMPVLAPAEVWQKTGRYYDIGPELMRLRDRHDRDMLLGPTHEEIVTDLVAGELRSYKKLPLNLYQIQVKFRDEIRPRFGLMRGREFIMKDAYSFDLDEEGLDVAYNKMVDAYFKAFKRCGLDTAKVESDTGAMGGTSAHEFMVIVETEGGEEVILSCMSCDYAANIERAESLPVGGNPVKEEPRHYKKVDTPGQKTVEEVTAFLNVKPKQLVKTLMYKAGDKVVAALIRGDRQINEVKLANACKVVGVEMLDEKGVEHATGAPVGFAGPVGMDESVYVIADPEVKEMTNFVVGANEKDAHLIDVNLTDFRVDEYATIRLSESGEVCPRCRKDKLIARKGIEVGNTFKLGTKYSKALNAVVLDEEGKERPLVMGSYGIGITRTAQAAVERGHDENGIIWPLPIAPFHVHLVCVNTNDETLVAAADQLYNDLREAGVEVLYDDRPERAGVKFADADLIGIPWRVTVGSRGLKDGAWEVRRRGQEESESIPAADFVSVMAQRVRDEMASFR
ncbi:MAG: proline--tRNA ligase [Candidatus Zixiibacteriota bacterium]